MTIRSTLSRVLTLGVSVLALGQSACVRFARSAFKPPVVVLQDVHVKQVGFQGGALDVILDVYNPNGYRIDARKVTYTVFADSLLVAAGELTQMAALDKRATARVVLPVTFSMKELTKAAAIFFQRGSVDYTVQGDFTLGTPFGAITRPYRSSGRYNALSR